jgi:hypothetical protein
VIGLLLVGCRAVPVQEPTECAPAEEIPYDGSDQDCDGEDLIDVDGDGYDADAVGGADCDDADPAVNPAAEEFPYDGVDQDCDGADSLDGDGDGYDASAVGGDDCDDGDAEAHPEATEIPYDGVDQDCDGIDLRDADGDGYDAEAVGGEDCDDADAGAHPGAAEAAGDLVDQDCDGRVDEVEACWDGSGDYLTIQEAAEAAPDGGIVEVCEGAYSETVELKDRTLTIEGGGSASATILANADRALTVTGELSDVRVYNMALGSDGPYTYAVYAEDIGYLMLDTIDLCTANAGGVRVESSLPARLEVRRSWVCAGDVMGYIDDGSVLFWQNIVEGDVRVEAGYNIYSDDLVSCALTVANNLFAAGDVRTGVGGDARCALEVTNNTFVGLDEFSQGTSCYLWESGQSLPSPAESCPSVSLLNNVYADFPIGEYGLFWAIWWADDAPSDAELAAVALPAVSSPNLGWDVSGGPEVYLEWHENYGWPDETSGTDTVDLSGLTDADPEFAVASCGSYGLSATSPAVDAGSGDPDADGTPADLGAFGGPDGDWCTEVPWALP